MFIYPTLSKILIFLKQRNILEKPKENDFRKMLKCWICAQKSPIYPILHIISVLFTNATSYRIVFRFVPQYYMIWSEHTFLSTVMCFWWKKQPFEKNTRESAAIVIAKKYRRIKIEFFWTDDEIQLLFTSALQFKCWYEYAEMNWESMKYERMQEIIVESYPRTNEDEKDFPNLQNPKVNLK